MHVIGPGFDIGPYILEMLDVWTLPIRLDPKWANGDYYGKDEPVDGVGQALKIVSVMTRAPGWADKTFGYKWADPARDPSAAMGNLFAIEDTLNKSGSARAKATAGVWTAFWPSQSRAMRSARFWRNDIRGNESIAPIRNSAK